MLRISLLKTALRSFLFVWAVSSATLSFAQPQLIFDFETTLVGDTVFVQLKTYNFNDILSMQFTMEWDESEMDFVAVQDFNLPGLTASNFGPLSHDEGYLTYSWFDPGTSLGVSMPDCSSLFTIKFLSLNGNATPIEINSAITQAFILDANQAPVFWAIVPSFCGSLGTVSGSVFNDGNQDCQKDAGEEGFLYRKIKLESSNYTFYSSTDANGDYDILVPIGNYDVSLVASSDSPWQSCTPPQNINVGNSSTNTIDFPLQALFDCPQMVVDLSVPFLRRCFSTSYHVQYCNEGTVTATSAYIEIEFDDFLTVQSSTIPWTTVNGNTYTFSLGDVAPGDCGTFSVQVETSCNAVLGQTHCTSAHIYPDDPCVPILLWDGSNLDITATCDGDSVRFEIINLGDDMAQPLEFIVIEDDMIHLTSDPILLLSQQTIHLAVPANGSTWRVEMPETPNNPYGTFTTEAVEGCGTNSGGSFSLGFVTQFPLDEESLAIDVDCQENIGSFDPNDKTGYPKGFCAAHYIRADQDIEYKIRFQNTGTDTAFNIIIIDTLSNFLSPASVRPGSSSHPYEFELLGEGVVKFSFPNAMLPDSNTNEPASHGFVKFTVSQQPNIPMGAVIENYAAIYFDFNDPVYTNTYRHTIGDDFVEMQGFAGDLNVSGYVRNWFDGSPVEGAAMTMTNLCPVFTDSYGYYLFEGIDTADYSLTASKEFSKPLTGATVLDMVKIRDHVLFADQLHPYQAIIADLNNSNSVTTFDIVVYRKAVLGIDAPGQFFKWRFFRADYIPTWPIDLTAQAYNYSPLEMNLDNQDFVALQPANVLDESQVELSPINTQFKLDVEYTSNAQVKVKVSANDYTTVRGFQFGLQWDASVLQYFGHESGVLMSFIETSIYPISPGHLTMVHLETEEATFGPNEVLFTLVFDVLAPTGAITELALDETNMPLQVVVDTCKLASASVTPIDVTIQDPNAVVDFEDLGLQVKVVPNPVQQGQPINLEVMTKEARSLQIQLFDLNGTAVNANTIQCLVGKSLHSWQQSLPKGIYFLKIRTERGKELTTKVVVF